jgi:hypothetical protein
MGRKNKHPVSRIPEIHSRPDMKFENGRTVINCRGFIDRSVFKKTANEKLLLKIAKSQVKDSNKKLT